MDVENAIAESEGLEQITVPWGAKLAYKDPKFEIVVITKIEAQSVKSSMTASSLVTFV